MITRPERSVEDHGGCGVAIRTEELEYELDIAGGGTLLFDAGCLAAWNEVRAERITA